MPRPIMLAVVGDSAAGKTTLTHGIARLLGPERVVTICSDDYHKYNRKQRKELGISALHPDCNYIDLMEQHTRLLRNNEPILKPIYNHSTGDFDPPEYIRPAPFIITDGLLALYSPGLRNHFDVKVYLDPPEELRHKWKIKRDTSKRGYTPEQVIASLQKREYDSATFIRPQRDQADIVVRFHPPAEAREETGAYLNVRLTLRSTLAHPDLSGIVKAANGNQPPVRLEIGREQGRLAEFMDIDGTIDNATASRVEQTIWGYLKDDLALVGALEPEGVGQYQDGVVERCSHPLALTQLLIAYQLISAKARIRREHVLTP
ncbi:MAG: phosphoribulokinase [Ardenticatenaceae bacterium]|nr:phosphoribulokinase [Ardenticatenaceae bacterium]